MTTIQTKLFYSEKKIHKIKKVVVNTIFMCLRRYSIFFQVNHHDFFPAVIFFGNNNNDEQHKGQRNVYRSKGINVNPLYTSIAPPNFNGHLPI